MADPAQWMTVPLDVGFYPDLAPRKSKGYYRTGTWVRWRNAQIEPIGGNERAHLTGSYKGTARKIHEWVDNSGYPVVSVGTHEGVFALFDTEIYDLTPIEEYTQLSANMTLVTSSSTITIDKTANGYAAGMRVRFPSQPTVGGIPLTSTYYISSVSTNSFIITTGMAATSGGSGLGGTIDMDVLLRPGNEFGAAGAGYGTGTYGTGLYGGTLASSYKARTWTFGNIGELLIANPRGGKIYEYAPAFSSTELAEKVTVGDFSITTSAWGFGTGWARDGANQEADATIVTASAALTQSVSLKSGRWHRLRFTVKNYSAGTLLATVGTVTVGAAITGNGRYVREFWNASQLTVTCSFAGTNNLTCSIDDVSLKVMNGLAWNQDAPALSEGILTTPQGHVMAWGTTPIGATTQDPLCVRTSDIDNTHVWTTAASNQAREFFLYGGSIILQGVTGPDGIYFTTNQSFWQAQYNPAPTVIFNFVPRAETGAGGLGVRSMCVAPDGVYWMSNQRQFKRFRGGRVETLQCPGEDTVFDNISWVQGDLAEAYLNPFNEVWFVYPDGRDGNEVSRYAAIMLDQQERWIFGQCTRTAWSPSNAIGYPIAAQSGIIYLHEKGDDDDQQSGIAWSARATAIEIGDGNTLGEVSGWIADVSSQTGPFSVRFYGYTANDRSTPEDSGTQTVLASDEYTQGFFVQGRQIDIEYSGRFPVKIGNPRILVQDTGNQF